MVWGHFFFTDCILVLVNWVIFLISLPIQASSGSPVVAPVVPPPVPAPATDADMQDDNGGGEDDEEAMLAQALAMSLSQSSEAPPPTSSPPAPSSVPPPPAPPALLPTAPPVGNGGWGTEAAEAIEMVRQVSRFFNCELYYDEVR